MAVYYSSIILVAAYVFRFITNDSHTQHSTPYGLMVELVAQSIYVKLLIGAKPITYILEKCK